LSSSFIEPYCSARTRTGAVAVLEAYGAMAAPGEAGEIGCCALGIVGMLDLGGVAASQPIQRPAEHGLPGRVDG
jgi:hypothetical protein